jgi:hypothetical protein
MRPRRAGFEMCSSIVGNLTWVMAAISAGWPVEYPAGLMIAASTPPSCAA